MISAKERFEELGFNRIEGADKIVYVRSTSDMPEIVAFNLRNNTWVSNGVIDLLMSEAIVKQLQELEWLF